MDGAIIVDGAIIIVGETSSPGGDFSEKSRLRLAAFLRHAVLAVATRKSRQGFPQRLAVAFAWRCAASSGVERSRATLPWDARPQ